MHEPDQHVSPIKNWKQLVVVVVLAFVVPIAVIIILSQWVTGTPEGRRRETTARCWDGSSRSATCCWRCRAAPRASWAASRSTTRCARPATKAGSPAHPRWATRRRGPRSSRKVSHPRSIMRSREYARCRRRAAIRISRTSRSSVPSSSWPTSPAAPGRSLRSRLRPKARTGPAKRSSILPARNATPPASAAHRRSATAPRGRRAWPRDSPR